jgi:starvation-inducible DNA-binding protein
MNRPVSREQLTERRAAALATPTDLSSKATGDLRGALNPILADVFALYVKTKNFHWHMSGPHFRDYHLLLDEQGEQLFAMTDPIAERIRKVGGRTLYSIGHIARLQRILDNDAEYVDPLDMLAELREDNKALAARLREAHNVCDEHRDIALPASSRFGSTKPSAVPGSYSKPAAKGTRRAISRWRAASVRPAQGQVVHHSKLRYLAG